MTKRNGAARPTEAADTEHSNALVPVGTMPRNAVAKAGGGVDGAVISDNGTTLVVGQPYVMRDRMIVADEVYYVDGLKSSDDGPWLGEADKVAWRDEATGYECIIMRATARGYLCGYVAVPPPHPLYGFEHGAIPPDLDVEVHGGLTYSRTCQRGPTPERRIVYEARSVCHVPRSARPPRYTPTTHATDYRVQHDDAWWFGFECNHVYDVVPNDRHDRRRFLAAETGAVYRDDAYVYNEVVNLAAQLRAIEDGLPKPRRTGAPPPPIGLDPLRGG